MIKPEHSPHAKRVGGWPAFTASPVADWDCSRLVSTLFLKVSLEKKVLAATGGRDRCRILQCHCVGKGIVPIYEIRTVILGIPASRGPIVSWKHDD